MGMTFDQVTDYFSNCKAYWMRQGDSEKVASSKAFWWDCVEVWNFDNTWNDAKRDMAAMFGYTVGDPVPAPDAVEKGLC